MQDRTGSGRARQGPPQPQKASATASLAPGALPLLGHTFRVVRDPLGWLDACRQAGPILRVKMGPRAAFLVTDPDLVHQVLTDKDFEKGGPLMDSARSLLGNGLATCWREDHRRQRPLMQPAFTLPRIAGYSAVMREEAVRLTATWTSHRETDLMNDLSSATMRVMIRAMLPIADEGEASRIAQNVRILLDGASSTRQLAREVRRRLRSRFSVGRCCPPTAAAPPKSPTLGAAHSPATEPALVRRVRRAASGSVRRVA